ncbi:uncharacterized protein AMSG_12013 [Thecamonas trahens ATCC 50062]|uniref:C3HC-type domain-containing protein n=1 Tax=Thecamonas trahens ATCC 50062 TaxID=461836 RepID=A0A0L0DDL7_THETB|nr:hypothetical protein AMSG_12013 [Thecamonas trahens ATCC 50062]KNC50315.1 hypothetical protein AMSG_12013 [Thecamonas trahens ATCC 50062]|eukprot:XP_013756980.1 hypothetical protein AMSG_12013 [Thecamonas trahens ATCC 50062]
MHKTLSCGSVDSDASSQVLRAIARARARLAERAEECEAAAAGLGAVAASRRMYAESLAVMASSERGAVASHRAASSSSHASDADGDALPAGARLHRVRLAASPQLAPVNSFGADAEAGDVAADGPAAGRCGDAAGDKENAPRAANVTRTAVSASKANLIKARANALSDKIAAASRVADVQLFALVADASSSKTTSSTTTTTTRRTTEGAEATKTTSTSSAGGSVRVKDEFVKNKNLDMTMLVASGNDGGGGAGSSGHEVAAVEHHKNAEADKITAADMTTAADMMTAVDKTNAPEMATIDASSSTLAERTESEAADATDPAGTGAGLDGEQGAGPPPTTPEVVARLRAALAKLAEEMPTGEDDDNGSSTRSNMPWDRQAFRRRVASFTPALWISSATRLSPLLAAAYGMEASAPLEAICVSCSGRIVVSLEPGVRPDAPDVLAAQIARVSSEAHSADCRWPRNPCPEAWAALPRTTTAALRNPASSAAIRPLLDLARALVTDAGSALPLTDLPGAAPPAARALVTALIAPQPGFAPISRSAAILALWGWSTSSRPATTVECGLCMRAVPLWCFPPATPPAAAATTTSHHESPPSPAPPAKRAKTGAAGTISTRLANPSPLDPAYQHRWFCPHRKLAVLDDD